jgi:hypothetical protein
MRTYYMRKIAEGKNKMAIINAIRNKLIHILIACINKDTIYLKTQQIFITTLIINYLKVFINLIRFYSLENLGAKFLILKEFKLEFSETLTFNRITLVNLKSKGLKFIFI